MVQSVEASLEDVTIVFEPNALGTLKSSLNCEYRALLETVCQFLMPFHILRDRAAILTGKYPESTGIYPGVFWADSVGGLPRRHKTLAERLSQLGYATTIIGKWHLGVGAKGEHLPTHRGFDRDYWRTILYLLPILNWEMARLWQTRFGSLTGICGDF